MTNEKCFCHVTVNGEKIAVKDKSARERLTKIEDDLLSLNEELEAAAETLALAREELELLIEKAEDKTEIIKRIEELTPIIEAAEESAEIQEAVKDIEEQINNIEKNFVKKVSKTGGFLYGAKDGVEVTYNVGVVTPAADSVVVRDSTGAISIATATKDYHAVTFKQFDDKIKSLSKVISTNANHIVNLLSDVKALKEVDSNYSASITSLIGRVATLEASTGNIDQVVSKDDLTVLEGKITSNETAIKELDTRINSIEVIDTTQIATNEENIKALAERVSDIEDENELYIHTVYISLTSSQISSSVTSKAVFKYTWLSKSTHDTQTPTYDDIVEGSTRPRRQRISVTGTFYDLKNNKEFVIIDAALYSNYAKIWFACNGEGSTYDDADELVHNDIGYHYYHFNSEDIAHGNVSMKITV